MYIERSIDSLLLEWKNSDRRKPLLLRGARQVGKSWAVEHLGRKSAELWIIGSTFFVVSLYKRS